MQATYSMPIKKQRCQVLNVKSKKRITDIQTKLQRLLGGYLEQDIDREVYREEKAKLLSDKKSLEEKTTNLEQKRTGWIEPMLEWIKEASSLPKIARESNLFSKKVAAKEIFGSNLVLANREARLRAPSGKDLSGRNAWAALCAATEMEGKFAKSLILEPGERIGLSASFLPRKRSTTELPRQ